MNETLSQLIRNTKEYSDVCDMCKDEILIYPTISGRTEYTQDEVEQITLKRIIDKLQAKEQECESWKKANDEKNKFLQDLGISASGEFKRIKFYIEDLKNKYNEKVKEYEELISEKDFYLQKIETLEEKLNAQFAEMEEKLTAEEMKNFELKEKLRIALASLNDIEIIDNYIVAQVDAQQALFMISEVENEIK